MEQTTSEFTLNQHGTNNKEQNVWDTHPRVHVIACLTTMIGFLHLCLYELSISISICEVD